MDALATWLISSGVFLAVIGVIALIGLLIDASAKSRG
jgi:hypothetical protein